MTDYLTGQAFAALFDSYEHTAFRLEVRDSYLGVPYEQERFRKFMAGEDDDEQRSRPWLDGVRRRAAEGKTMSRVRVVSVPPTDYARYAFYAAKANIIAGEDIRYLSRPEASQLPDYDFWLFDSSRLYLMHYTEDDASLGAVEITDPSVILRHAYWRDAAWHHAVPYDQFSF